MSKAWMENKHKRIIGFCGYKRTGKNEGAKALSELGYKDYQFSEGLKVMLRAFLIYNGVENPELYTDDWMKSHRSRYFCDKEFRHVMQSLGTDWGQKMVGTRFWINAWERKIKDETLVTVSDVRFPAEVDAIKEKGGIIIKVRRPSFVNQDGHESETLMESLKCDYEVVNDTLVRYQDRIRKIEREHFKK